MTGRRLYDKYVDALFKERRVRWDSNTRQNVYIYPEKIPPGWPFLSDNERYTWNALARSLTPRRRKP